MNTVKILKTSISETSVEEVSKTYEGLSKELKDALGDAIKSVEVTTDLVDSPVALKIDKDDAGYMVAQMMKQMGQGGDTPDVAPILQILPN